MTEIWDARHYVPDHLREVIVTPHEHENAEHNRPLWLIWKMLHLRDGERVEGPHLHAVCDEEDLALANVGALFISPHPHMTIFVERIPANHVFASSLYHVFEGPTLTKVKHQYRRVGD